MLFYKESSTAILINTALISCLCWDSCNRRYFCIDFSAKISRIWKLFFCTPKKHVHVHYFQMWNDITDIGCSLTCDNNIKIVPQIKTPVQYRFMRCSCNNRSMITMYMLIYVNTCVTVLQCSYKASCYMCVCECNSEVWWWWMRLVAHAHSYTHTRTYVHRCADHICGR